jgi:hypothetical protein
MLILKSYSRTVPKLRMTWSSAAAQRGKTETTTIAIVIMARVVVGGTGSSGIFPPQRSA